MKQLNSLLVIIILIGTVLTGCGQTSDDTSTPKEKPAELLLATTTTTRDTGLLDELIPVFEEEYNVKTKLIVAGTGEALTMAENGEADALLVHSPSSEKPLVDNGDVINYKQVMYNDFVLVGPKDDPAGVQGMDIVSAFTQIEAENAAFVSRGDDSGTHKKELELWKAAAIDPLDNSGYIETGQGQGQTLQVANEKQAYCLVDRGTFLAYEKNIDDYAILVEGEEILRNIYHVMQVSPDKNDQINAETAADFVEFMVSDQAQTIIKDFGVAEYGEPLFHPYLDGAAAE